MKRKRDAMRCDPFIVLCSIRGSPEVGRGDLLMSMKVRSLLRGLHRWILRMFKRVRGRVGGVGSELCDGCFVMGVL